MAPFIQPFLDALNNNLQQSIDCIVSVVPENASPSVKRIAELTREMLQYNCAGGKKIRGCLLLASYNALHACNRDNNESPCVQHVLENKPAIMLAWSLEILQASFLVADDMMDGSLVRRGLPCWYVKVAERNRLDEDDSDLRAGSAAINDVCILCHGSWRLVNTFFDAPVHKRIMSEMHDVFLETAIGQHLDMDKKANNSVDNCLRTMDFSKRDGLLSHVKSLKERYWSMVLYKTSFYSFRLPITLAFILAQSEDASVDLPNFDSLVDLAYLLGQIFQMRDDMLDWVDVPGTNKTQYTDILEGKLTWPFLKALEVVINENNVSDFLTLKNSYSRHQDKIVQLYKRLHIEERYREESNRMMAEFRHQVNQLHHPPIQLVLLTFLEIFCSPV